MRRVTLASLSFRLAFANVATRRLADKLAFAITELQEGMRMILDFFRKLRKPHCGNPLAKEQRALSERQAATVAELRANGFHALSRWFAENPEYVA